MAGHLPPAQINRLNGIGLQAVKQSSASTLQANNQHHSPLACVLLNCDISHLVGLIDFSQQLHLNDTWHLFCALHANLLLNAKDVLHWCRLTLLQLPVLPYPAAALESDKISTDKTTAVPELNLS